jgi:hypothetical protein
LLIHPRTVGLIMAARSEVQVAAPLQPPGADWLSCTGWYKWRAMGLRKGEGCRVGLVKRC